MSLLPFRDALDDLGWQRNRPGSIFDQYFGMGVFNDDLLHPNWILPAFYPRYVCPSLRNASLQLADVQNTNDCFKVNIDVQQFKPDEVSVKTTDNYIVVEGKHEERKDEHGYISRQFQRRYWIPDDVDPQAIFSKLSSDGVLSIEAPKKCQLSDEERKIPITHTNAPAVTSQPQQKSSKNFDK